VPEPVTLDPTLPLDAVTFASSATAERFVAGIGQAAAAALAAGGCRFYAIGPTTAATVRALGLPLAATADDATVAGLVAAVTRDLSPSPR
jgi:uroporphyrinogen-III synthase